LAVADDQNVIDESDETNNVHASDSGAVTLSGSGSSGQPCGTERWPVKTGTDADAKLVDLTTSTATTIANLVSLSAPANKPDNNRVQSTETTVYALNATLTQYKLEDDSDFHLVLQDATGNTMIAEIPDAQNCVGAGSPFLPAIANARSQFNAQLSATTSFKTANVPVQVKGVGFFDFIHGQTGVAPNGIELHPVLDLNFNPTTSTPPPIITSPAANSGVTHTITMTFSAAGGYQTLQVVNILINGALDAGRACYAANVPGLNTFLLVDDAGDAGGPFAGTVVLGTSGAIRNSQCALTLVSATGSGNNLTLSLSITFPATFGGNRIIYGAARDAAGNNSGWLPVGVWNVPGAASSTTTAVGGMTPPSGTGFGPSTFTFSFNDTKGVGDLGVQNVLINSALDGGHACYLAYSKPYNLLFLVNDAGTGTTSGITPGGTGSISNSQCTVNAAGSTASGSGNNLVLTLNMSFAPPFGGNRIVYMASRDSTDANNSGWQAMGIWTVQ
jgi:hypothetical protein